MFKKIKYFFIGMMLPVISGALNYNLNMRSKNELLVIIINLLLLTLFIWFIKKENVVSLGFLTKKQFFQWLFFLGLSIALLFIYTSIFDVTSNNSDYLYEKITKGLSLSFIVTVSVLGPIQEELTFRGLIQEGVFKNSWLGIILTTCVFALLHEPTNIVSFIYYALSASIFALSLKSSKNLLVPILCHMGYNSFITLYVLLF
ncbi:CPBP family intramembrane glutamic endopeptidase [Streptococcus pacificus]|uniref:CPBP family intramembrane metalloprotease n=1 Tax=Streptococcus pacificus TaxID=2740577 RepID=A0ABS0ZK23_9STRE|nr:CPBP family intramembrane glutamic endopeptidase [Streptococcus pacificus]MBJ8326058.1 CPBP family intramembrane metalloprotease [Streptococcus pacificus]